MFVGSVWLSPPLAPAELFVAPPFINLPWNETSWRAERVNKNKGLSVSLPLSQSVESVQFDNGREVVRPSATPPISLIWIQLSHLEVCRLEESAADENKHLSSLLLLTTSLDVDNRTESGVAG